MRLDLKAGSSSTFDWIDVVRSGDFGKTPALMAQMELLTLIGETYVKKVRVVLSVCKLIDGCVSNRRKCFFGRLRSRQIHYERSWKL